MSSSDVAGAGGAVQAHIAALRALGHDDAACARDLLDKLYRDIQALLLGETGGAAIARARPAYYCVADVFLTEVLRDWVGCFSAEETHMHFDRMFRAWGSAEGGNIPAALVMDGLLACLRKWRRSVRQELEHGSSADTVDDALSKRLTRREATRRVVKVSELMRSCLFANPHVQQPGTNVMCGIMLRSAIEADCAKSCCSADATYLATEALCRDILSIPDLIAAHVGSQLPMWLCADHYYPNICAQVMRGCVFHFLENGTENGSHWDACATIVGFLVNRGHGNILARCWVSAVPGWVKRWKTTRSASIFMRHHDSLLSCLQLNATERILVCIISMLGDDDLIRTMKPNIQGAPEAHESHIAQWPHEFRVSVVRKTVLLFARPRALQVLFTRKLLLNHTFSSVGDPELVARTLVSALTQICRAETTSLENARSESKRTIASAPAAATTPTATGALFLETAMRLAGVWSDSQFILGADFSQHEHVTLLLLKVLHKISKESLNGTSSDLSNSGVCDDVPSVNLLNTLLGGVHYGAAVDMWSVGCILAEILGRKVMFRGASYIHQLQLIVQQCGTPSATVLGSMMNDLPHRERAQYEAAIAQCGLQDPSASQTGARLAARFPNADPEAVDLLHKLLTFDPSQRITVEQALAHPWLQEYHATSKEPSCDSPFDFSWEAQYDLSDKQTLRKLFVQEMANFRQQSAPPQTPSTSEA